MDQPAAPNSSGPIPTIVVERKPRASLLSRIWFILLLILLLAGVNAMVADSGLFPSTLSEEYVAGPIGPGQAKIAVVRVEGVIDSGSADRAIRQIRQAAQDDAVRAVVLRVDSPGGTVSDSDRIWRELNVRLKGNLRKKHLVVSMGDYAASGGYYVSAPADRIFAEPTTLTGSIGVIVELPQLDGLLEKVGVKVQTVAAGEHKEFGSMFKPMTPEERKRWEQIIDHSYQRFLRVVAQGRGFNTKEVVPIANGQVLTAEEARSKRLVDEIGYLDDAIRHAQSLVGLESIQVIRYATPVSLRDTLLGMGAKAADANAGVPRVVEQLRTPRVMLLAH